ncbi:LpqB family beta-propeller domain-containing protein [Streptomyces sp. NPDC086023]|uniref:LpqB family beta-propeller domain-containing protein n=1 Tax=Streptomyces sp. NPDC086023 TaxID=3365746 RepID=UPI0037D4CB2A
MDAEAPQATETTGRDGRDGRNGRDARNGRGTAGVRGRRLRVAGALGCGALLLAGCASMPDSGEVKQVEASQGVDSQVRVFGVPPKDKATPFEIVDGFLEAMTSDDPKLAIAREYLTKRAAAKWNPGKGITVLSSELNRQRLGAGNDQDEEGQRFELSGNRLARVDERSAYQPEAGNASYKEFLQLVKEDNQWRIDGLPDGLVLGESDFQRIFRSVNKYYFAAGMLVADPVFVRQRPDPESRMDAITQTVQSLLAGPSKWLGPVVGSSFPTGTALRDGTRTLSYDGDNALRVPLNGKADNVADSQCRRMATQLLFTVKDVTASRVTSVELLRSDGKSALCQVGEPEATVTANRFSNVSPQHQYYVDPENRLRRIQLMSDSEARPEQGEPVAGPLATAQLKIGSAAVAHDEKRTAVISENGREMYVVSLTTGGPLGQPVLTSKAPANAGTGHRLSAPSWDGRGDLWVADRNPADPAVWVLNGGEGTPQRVDVAGLHGGRIESLRVSSDGVRIALLIEKDGRHTLHVGRIERPDARGGSEETRVLVRELRPAAPQMADVTAMSWASRGRLLVVGREAGGVVQARYMQADGSAVVSGSLPGATGLSAIAASEDEKAPVVAYSGTDGIVWLPPGAQWRTVVDGGSAPVYPG